MPFGFIMAVLVLALGLLAALALPRVLAAKMVNVEEPKLTDRYGYDATTQTFELAADGKDDAQERRAKYLAERKAQAAPVARRIRRLILLTTLALTGLFLFMSSATMVPARHVAVPVTFGHPGESMGEGFHFVAPWTRVEKFDATTQTFELAADGKDRDGAHVPVRLGNQTTADVDVNRGAFNLSPDRNIQGVYRRYNSQEKVEKNLVIGETKNALVQVLGGFDPLAALNSQGETKTKTVAELQEEIRKVAQAAIDSKVGAGAIVYEAPQIFINYDPTTQAKLNDFAKSQAETRIAEQSKLTATAVRQANEELAKGASVAGSSPTVLYQNCLQLLRDLAAREQLGQLPVNSLQCVIPGTNASNSPVLVQPK